MKRRQFNLILSSLAGLGASGLTASADALTLAEISGADAIKGLKSALEKGALSAIGQLGAKDGFMADPKVHIELPGHLDDAAKFMRKFGQGEQVDALELAINRAAEAAVPEARDLLLGAVRSLTIDDAKRLLSGSDTAISSYFAEKTRPALATRFLPIVTKATANVSLADKYNQVAGKAAEIGLLQKEQGNIQQFVTGKALDGLFLKMSDEERIIRQNPAQAGSALLKKVFGAL